MIYVTSLLRSEPWWDSSVSLCPDASGPHHEWWISVDWPKYQGSVVLFCLGCLESSSPPVLHLVFLGFGRFLSDRWLPSCKLQQPLPCTCWWLEAPGMEVSVYLPCCLTSRNPCFALGKILSALEEFFSYTFLASCHRQFLLCAQGSSGAPRGVSFCKPNSGLCSSSCTFWTSPRLWRDFDSRAPSPPPALGLWPRALGEDLWGIPTHRVLPKGLGKLHLFCWFFFPHAFPRSLLVLSLCHDWSSSFLPERIY